MDTDATDLDLLAPAPGERLVSVPYIARELRRHRAAIVALALAGALVGLALSDVVPKQASARTTVLLQFPSGTDPEPAMETDLDLLETRAVAETAVQALGLSTEPENFLGQYRGTILSDRVMRISADGDDESAAERRADAVAAAFLDLREQVYSDQLDVVVTARRNQQAELRRRVSALTEEIQAFVPTETASATPIDDLLTERAALNAQIQEIESAIQSDTVATSVVVRGSRVIDTAHAVEISARRTAAVNAVSGFIAGLAIGLGGFTLLAVVSTRVRRRADVATAMRAPVSVSVGSIFPTGWRRLVPHRRRSPARPNADVQLIVRHLQSVLTTAPTAALVVVAIDSLRVATLAVQALEHKLVASGRQVSIVNETGGPLLGQEPRGDKRPVADDPALDADVVLVLATLDPAKGAEHLREWAANAVAFVTAGRSSGTKLEANAAMIRSAALHLRSVVLIRSDRSDDSLGIFEKPSVTAVGLQPAAIDDSNSASRSS